jgi:hypothetical protein
LIMFISRRSLLVALVSIAAVLSVNAQSVNPAPPEEPTAVAASLPQDTDAPYTLKQGDNEFGFWAGGSFAAFTAFGGLKDAEAADRKFFLAAFRYGRTLAANDTLALQYTLDAIPIAVATNNITSVTTVGPITTFQRDTAYGAGVTPLGLQLDFANGSRVHPFIHVNGGLLVFNQAFPLPDAGSLAFGGEAGGGVRIFTSERRAVTLGVRLHHISNGDRSGSNRG